MCSVVESDLIVVWMRVIFRRCHRSYDAQHSIQAMVLKFFTSLAVDGQWVGQGSQHRLVDLVTVG